MPDIQRRTKIVATLGPASESPEMIRRLAEAGVNIFRLNFSHGTHESHGRAIENIRRISQEMNAPIAILQDLQGPKMRVGQFVNGEPITLTAGEQCRVTTEEIIGDAKRFSCSYDELPNDVRRDDLILLDDGRLQLKALGVEGRDVLCEVVVGGMLSEHKGLNLPHTPLSAPCLTPKDIKDLKFGLERGVDFIGLSFVRRVTDIEDLRVKARALGKEVAVISKIERVEAVEAIAEIIAASDGVMIARGDLAVETSSAEVPVLQKRILALAGRAGKPDITATQMLETMVSNPQPSRAEATDVANAVFDGTDAIMLSAESAVGKYPVESVRMMSQIASFAERHLIEFQTRLSRIPPVDSATIAESSVHAACRSAEELKAAAIIVFTLSGKTAFHVASHRPSSLIVALTPNEQTYRRLALAWGVRPVLSRLAADPNEFLAIAEDCLTQSGLLKRGDHVVMLSGRAGSPGATNIMKLHRVGDPD